MTRLTVLIAAGAVVALVPSLAAPAGALPVTASASPSPTASASTTKPLPSDLGPASPLPKYQGGLLTDPAVAVLPPAGSAVTTLLGAVGFVSAGSLPIAVLGAGAGAPDSVKVTSLGPVGVAAVGGQALGFQLTRHDGGVVAAPVQVQVDYSTFKEAYGANWASRLQVWKLPGCVLDRPNDNACRSGVQVAGVSNDLVKHTLSLAATAEPDPSAASTSASASPTPGPSSSLAPSGTPSASASIDPSASPAASPTAAPSASPLPSPLSSPSPGVSPGGSGSPSPSGAVVSPSASPFPSVSPSASGTPAAKPRAVGAGVAGVSVFVLAGGSSSSAGNYGATPLAASGSWSVGLQSGSFQYNVAVPTPPSVGGAAPAIGWSYSSGGVDGRSSAANTQGSWAGLGWDVGSGFIERSFANCSVVALSEGHHDLCWPGVSATQSNLVLNFQGHTGRLFPTGVMNEYRLEQDPGWRVIRQTSVGAGVIGANGVEQGESWIVITPDGIKYYFGLGTNGPTGTKVTNSAWNVPVVATAPGQRCYSPTLSVSWCQQAWRWNLDAVVDTHLNLTAYYYGTEGNRYSLEGNTAGQPYTRDGYLGRIDYGLTTSAPDAVAPARIQLTAGSRCTVQVLDHTKLCPVLVVNNGAGTVLNTYPDTPSDQLCTAICTAAQDAPTFWTSVSLDQIQTQWFNSAVYVPVDTFVTTFEFPTTPDGSEPALFMASLAQTGQSTQNAAPTSILVPTSLTLPAYTFNPVLNHNRVDYTSGVNLPLYFPRLQSIVNPLGATTSVTYTTAAGSGGTCGEPGSLSLPVYRDNNSQNCYEQPATDATGTLATGWFNKYVVSQVLVNPGAGGGAVMSTQYAYFNAPNALYDNRKLWRYDSSPVQRLGTFSYDDFVGYPEVWTTEGSNTQGRATTLTQHLYFRGLQGDPVNTTGGNPTSNVIDTGGHSTSDIRALSGQESETRSFSGTIAFPSEISDAITSYVTPMPGGVANTNVSFVQPVRTDTYLDNVSGPRRDLRVLHTYDAMTGQPTTADDLGEVGASPSQERCTFTGYAPNAAAWLTSYPNQIALYAGPCGTGTLAQLTQISYDFNTLSTPPVLGNPTFISRLTGTTAVSSTSSTFDSYGRVTSVKDAKNQTTTTVYAPTTGYPATITTTNPAGDVSIQGAFDWGRGKATMSTDPGGKVSRVFLDPLGRVSQVYTPDEIVGLTSATSGCPEIQYAYAVSGDGANPSKVTTLRLQSAPLPLTCATAVGVESDTYLDGLGRSLETQTQAPSAANRTVTRTIYDERGNVLLQSKPQAIAGTPGSGLTSISLPFLASYSVNTIDAVNRVAAVDLYSLAVLQWRQLFRFYLADGYLQTPAITPGQATPNSKRYAFDGHGQLTAVDEAASLSTPTVFSAQTTRYQYSAKGDLTSTTNPNGGITSSATDGVGRVISTSSPDAGAWSYTYDNAGNLASSTDALGQSLLYSYDSANRKTGVFQDSITTANQLASFTYNTTGASRGLLASSSSIYGANTYTRSYVYDDRNRVATATVTIPAGESFLAGSYADTVSFDKADHVISESMPALGTGTGSLAAETVTSPYSAQGFPTTLTGAVTYVSSTGYADNGQLNQRGYGGTPTAAAVSRFYTYEPNTQRLSTVAMIAGPIGTGTTLDNLTYAFDNANNVLSTTDAVSAQRQCFSYDGQFRLTLALTTAPATACSATAYSASGPAPYSTSLGYDVLGNITTVKDNLSSTTTSYSYTNGHPDQVSSVGATPYAYNANGATTGIGAVSLAWDRQHRLASVTAGATVTANVYDADGARLIVATPTSKTLFLPSGEISVTLPGGVKSATRYYTSGTSMVAVRTPTTLSYLGHDLQNSDTISVDATTLTASRRLYAPFGTTRSATGTFPTTRGYLNKTLDPTTGLTNLGARYYYPALGRFLNPDPLNTPGGLGGNDGSPAPAQTDPQQSNPYSYAANNPNTFVDPSGLNLADPGPGNAECLKVDCVAVAKKIYDDAFLVANDSGAYLRSQVAPPPPGPEPTLLDFGLLAASFIPIPGPEELAASVETERLLAFAKDLETLAASGAKVDRGGLTAVGRSFEKHQGEGAFPSATGNVAAKNAVGKAQLQDILTTPGTRLEPVLKGNFAGGTRYIAPDGRGATFDSTGQFQYFGVYP